MLITKLDLYKGEWLDLVFTNRNKSYGAYELRQSYGKTMTKAMGIAFAFVAASILAFTINKKPVVIEKPLVDKDIETVVDLSHAPKVEKPVEPAKSEIPKTPPPAKAEAAKTTAIPTKVTSDPVPDEPPTKTEIETSAVGPTKSEGVNTPGNAPEGTPDGSDKGGGTVSGTEDTGIHDTFETMEKMPMPVGGQQAWTKFLQRNLRFPSEAQEQGVNGRVFISFIIEKDGKLSDITVLRGGEHGFGEEALRVLKKAAAWTPGIQNGRPVRVKYVIPINFQMPE
ncbi:energy transducer TonB [Mucilaginibacter limnophilus]|uniref:Energy transducer TonB n=1 Tax=Mucilaginibacter limnophilus TaxID=1932778 RepID=A0A3S2Y628_9SPHI|nr:energy transducer TonB [Mucilaginibacter limnophilus]RVU02961.1 energy transducer TonB [Mucilaginibacter limnophilus]